VFLKDGDEHMINSDIHSFKKFIIPQVEKLVSKRGPQKIINMINTKMFTMSQRKLIHTG
jgi:hypothetical protein